jgi:hypothetical protein
MPVPEGRIASDYSNGSANAGYAERARAEGIMQPHTSEELDQTQYRMRSLSHWNEDEIIQVPFVLTEGVIKELDRVKASGGLPMLGISMVPNVWGVGSKP